MARLRGNPDIAKLFEAVKDYELALTELLIGTLLPQHQGGIKALRTLRETFESAPDTIRKLTGR